MMTTRVDFVDNFFREKRRDRSSRLEKASQRATRQIERYCIGRLARDLEVRNCLKSVEHNAAHPSAAACAAEVIIQLEDRDD